MSSTVILTITTPRSVASLSNILLSATAPRSEALALSGYFKAIAAGIEVGPTSFDIQTSATGPVAASSTYTLASVVATNTAIVGKTTLTYSAGAPSTENDVNVTIGSAKAFASSTDITGGIITETAHGYLTGDVGQLTTSSSLPTGFALSTDYHVIRITADTYALASTHANALAAIRIVPTTAGVGNQTLTLNANKSLASRLEIAINAHSVASTIVSASTVLAVVTVTAKQKGVIGNFVVASSSGGTITVTGSGYLAGGTGGATSTAISYARG